MHGKSFKDALEAVARPSHGWASAASYQGGIQLHTGVRNSTYDLRALREFQLALESGDILVQVEGRIVRPEFWRQDWSFEVRGERLLSAFKNFVRTVEGLAPRLVVLQPSEGLNPPVSAKSLSDIARPSEEAAQTTLRSVAVSPADKPGPKPGVSGKVRVTELADELRRDEKIHLPEGRGRTTRLAEMIHERLTDEGWNYQLDSVKRTLRDLKI